MCTTRPIQATRVLYCVAVAAQSALQFEREVARRLPELLGELLGELLDDGDDRRWTVIAKLSSSPGTVAGVADRVGTDALALLVVPYMTAGGARAAAERRLNWVDLAGNASLRDEGLFVRVQGRPNAFLTRGRTASAFAPRSSRVARALLLDPARWWTQKQLSERTSLDKSQVSRAVARLDDDRLLDRDGARLRPRDRDLLLDAWAEDYRFDRHDVVIGHLTGSGVELARALDARLVESKVAHAFTGLAAAWALDRFARFRLTSVYVDGDPRAAADEIGLRLNERGANVQLIGPDDGGVFDGQRVVDGLPCVAPVQTYLDLGHLPERAAEAAEHLRASGAIWHGAA